MLGAWLLVAGLTQGIPAAVYQATSVGPNEQTAQTPTIADYLTTSRYAWALQTTGPNAEVQNRNFGTPHAPTLTDLESDLGTLQNVRIQDPDRAPGHPGADRPHAQLSDLLDDHRRPVSRTRPPAPMSR